MKVLLFALTGLGNIVVEKLTKLGIEIEAVISRKEHGKYPYFEIEPLENLCARLHVDKIDVPEKGSNWIELIKDRWNSSDLVLSATFHRIIPIDKLQRPLYGAFNIHPSILPKHKGPTPVFWAVLNDNEYGYTVHALTSKADSGDYYYQQDFSLLDATLGNALSYVYERVGYDLPNILDHIINKKIVKPKTSNETYDPRPKYEEFSTEINLSENTYKNYKKILAHIPYPGVFIEQGGKQISLKNIIISHRSSLFPPDKLNSISLDNFYFELVFENITQGIALPENTLFWIRGVK